MPTLSKDIKLLTLSLIVRTLPKDQRSLLMQHFSPEVTQILTRIEEEAGSTDVANLDWTPFYQSWPELKKILNDCKVEIKAQNLIEAASEQRPRLKEYILIKLGRQKKGAPVFLSQEILKVVDRFLTTLG